MSKRPTYQWLHLMGDYLPSFLDKLERNGFAIGIEKQLRIQEVLRKLPENTPLTKIKTTLCPLIASNEKEQAQFYDLFEAHFPKTTNAPKPNTEPPAIEIPKPDITPYVVGTFFALLLITAINFYFNNPFQEDDVPVIIENPQVEIPVDTTNLAPIETPRQPDFSEINKLIAEDQARLAAEEEAKRTQWDELLDVYHDNKWFIKIFLLSLLLLPLIAYELYRRRKRRLISERTSSNKPPFVWDINPDTEVEISYGEQFDTALHRLRTRELGAQVRLDMPASIGATTRQGGIIQLQYKANTRPSEYLLLIDRNANKSHQAQLFNRIYQDLRDNEVYVERFFYDGDPRICWNERQHTGIRIEQLAAKYSDYRLLLFGNASRLINPRTGQIQEWADIFDTWQHKAIFTPTPTAAWHNEELLLAEEFIVLPSNVEGMIQAVSQFETGKRSDLLLQKTPNLHQKQAIRIDETKSLASLKQHFDEPMLQWIAACAIYPELNWDLTLHIGQLLSTEENDLLRLENLLAISQLEWFQLGEMPNEVRAELLTSLPEDTIQHIRTSIIELLKQNPPPPDSHAYDDYRMQLLVQELLLTPDQRQKQKEQQLAALSQAGIEQDFTILKYLDRHKSKLDFLIPSNLKSTFFEGGHAFYGLRSWVRWVLFGLLAAFVLWFDLPEQSKKNTFDLQIYPYVVDNNFKAALKQIPCIVKLTYDDTLQTTQTSNLPIIYEVPIQLLDSVIHVSYESSETTLDTTFRLKRTPYLLNVTSVQSVPNEDNPNDSVDESKNIINNQVIENNNSEVEFPIKSWYTGQKSDSFPIRKSLEQYCPTPKNQGNTPSVISYAIAYAAMTTQYAIENNIKNRQEIDALAFSPTFVHNQLTKGDCKRGVRMSDALEFIQQNGACKYKDFDTKVNDCEQPNEELIKLALRNKIDHVNRLFNVDAVINKKIFSIKQSIVAGKPVVISLVVTDSFKEISEDNSTYTPFLQDKDEIWANTAVVIIGYDDISRKFRMMNSWGQRWGDGGFFEMSYDDLGKSVKYAYVLELENSIKNSPLTPPIVEFELFEAPTDSQVGVNIKVIALGSKISSLSLSTPEYYREVDFTWENNDSLICNASIVIPPEDYKIEIGLKNSFVFSSFLKLKDNKPKKNSLLIKPEDELLFIGVSGNGNGDIRYAHKDVEDVGELFLQKSITRGSIEIYQNPTKKTLEKKLHLYSTLRRDTGLIVFFYSGHTKEIDNQLYLLSSDTSPNSPESLVSFSKIFEDLKPTKSGKIIIILDICNYGSDTYWSSLVNDNPNVAILVSSSPSQQALEDPGLENSIFTDFIIKCVKDNKADTNQDSIINLGELYRFLQKNVSRFSFNQNPYLLIGNTSMEKLPLFSIRKKD